ncbi:MAG: Type 1 glutamine amidotransferase-like domain-containing protein, partial [Candidatus Limnocylindrales bacterium]|nr:Type 1 glutamine amidotransferase-like domain-containing protein [Candidatus Limnocylindrales bacterium]
MVLAGLSAGSVCWFESGTTDSFGKLAAFSGGLGLLPGSHSPHYDGDPERRPTYRRLIAEGALSDGYAADDGAALVFRGTELAEVVASKPAARAYRVARGPAGDAVETELADPLPGLNRPPGVRGRVPDADRANGTGVFPRDLAASGGLHGSAPTGRHEPGCEVGQGGEDEEPLLGRRMRHDQKPCGRDRVRVGVERPGLRRSLDREARSSEDEEVEVELARAPAAPATTP